MDTTFCCYNESWMKMQREIKQSKQVSVVVTIRKIFNGQCVGFDSIISAWLYKCNTTICWTHYTQNLHIRMSNFSNEESYQCKSKFSIPLGNKRIFISSAMMVRIFWIKSMSMSKFCAILYHLNVLDALLLLVYILQL